MNDIITALAMLFFLLANAQAKENDSLWIVGKRYKVASQVLQEERAVWVHLPKAYDDSLNSKERYPVIYVLDADLNFLTVTGVQTALYRGGRSRKQDAIIVGVENTDRTRDLTPTPAMSTRGQATLANSGGGERFVAFLEKELLPMIDHQFRTAERRILIGHSFGGLTTINIFLKHTPLFSDYLVIDPSLWWDNFKLLKEAKDLINQPKYANVTIFIASAGKSNDEDVERKGVLPLPKLLDKLHPSGLHWQYRRFEEEDHGSVVLPSLFYGLRFLYQ
ncbi:alpha/beta hydrolase-fold protein [Olivibacter ginsenosidimutans]|uniref:Alpha/beta hydrolase-fold protein n=1 Tax=Olivibacter ginsenosidimutans TaxID=1176537 RepID=A0ABP9BPU2_9SPHI